MVLLHPDGPLYPSINKPLTRELRLRLQVSLLTPPLPKNIA